jgi:hypothetical protein
LGNSSNQNRRNLIRSSFQSFGFSFHALKTMPISQQDRCVEKIALVLTIGSWALYSEKFV